MNDINNNLGNPDVLTTIANLSNDEVFTDPKTAAIMINTLPKELWSNPEAKFLDPVSKSGIFLREIAMKLNEGLKDIIKDDDERITHILTKQVYGIAISELTSLISRRTLYNSKDATSKNSVLNGKIFKNIEGNIFFHEIKHTFVNGVCKYCKAPKALERDSNLNNYAYQIIHDDFPKELKNMKFDVIIGNPPYQMNDGGGSGSSAAPIYHKFINEAKRLNPKYISMIVPARWYSGGKGLKNFRKEMLADERITHIVDYKNEKDAFSGVEIMGGIMYFLWDKHAKGNVKVANFQKNEPLEFMERPLLEEGLETFIRQNEFIKIVNDIKKQSKTHSSMKDMVYSRKPFGFGSDFIEFAHEGQKDLVRIKARKEWGFVKRSQIKNNADTIDKYKVFMGKANGAAMKNRKILSVPFVAKPGEVCTETYLMMGSFDTELEANNLVSYIKTKFFRFLTHIVAFTQNMSKDAFLLVPQLDFKKEWSDESLYDLFNLDEKERRAIEETIAEM